MRQTRIIVSLVIVAIALVGCSDDDDAAPTTTTPADAAPTTTTPADTSPPTTTPADTSPPTTGMRGDDDPLPGGWYRATAEADLELRVVVASGIADSGGPDPEPDQLVLPGPEGELTYLLGPVELDGSIVDRTRALFDELNGWAILIEMTPEGAVAFDDLAASIVGEQLALVSDGVVLTAAQVAQASFGGAAIISGDFEAIDADRIARQVAGAS